MQSSPGTTPMQVMGNKIHILFSVQIAFRISSTVNIMIKEEEFYTVLLLCCNSKQRKTKGKG